MGKRFWKYIVLFWTLLLLAGFSTFLYIKQQQSLERKEYVAQFNYDVQQEEDLEMEVSIPLTDYSTVHYTEESFLQSVKDTLSKVSAYETTVESYAHINHADALEYTLNAYQDTKAMLSLYANVTFIDTGLLDEKIYIKISKATYHYLKAASIHFIVQARVYNRSSETLNIQLIETKTAMETSKKYVQHLLDLTKRAM